jgi:hypothetical protein
MFRLCSEVYDFRDVISEHAPPLLRVLGFY